MLRTVLIFLTLALYFPALDAAPNSLEKVPMRKPIRFGPTTEITTPDGPISNFLKPPPYHLDQHVGLVDTAGFTYYDYQHNGTCGKMIDVDGERMVALVWMNGLTSDLQGPRHVYYNVWDPTLGDFMYDTIGILVDPSSRAGFVTAVVNETGFCFPAFHEVLTGDDAHSAGAIDYAAYADAYTTQEPPYIWEGGSALSIIFPHIAMDIYGDLHMVNTEWGGIDRMYYVHGHPNFDQDGFGLDITWDEFELVDTLNFFTPDIAASRHSERIAMAWLTDKEGDKGGNNIYLAISEDAGANWDERINITNFEPPNTACRDSGGDMRICNGDTLRPWVDIAIILDENDFVHLAWTSSMWIFYDDNGDSAGGPWTYRFASQIHHWGEDHHEFNIVADAFYGNNGQPESNSYNLNRPNLAVDPTNDYLYCTFQLFDTIQYSENMFPMADAWVTVSTDNGRRWSVATNVTQTDGGVETPAPGSLSERHMTLAPCVTEGILHMEYILDLDAGSSVFQQGIATRNPVIYQRIPVDSIPTTPIIDPCRPLRVDSTGYPWDLCGDAIDEISAGPPSKFLLYQNYPNPFNPTTTIQFDLTHPMTTTLKVYNIIGEEVTTLLNKVTLSAGVHGVNFDASDLSSGVYIYRLTSETHAATKKMILLK